MASGMGPAVNERGRMDVWRGLVMEDKEARKAQKELKRARREILKAKREAREVRELSPKELAERLLPTSLRARSNYGR
jgi:hypothetical protein